MVGHEVAPDFSCGSVRRPPFRKGETKLAEKSSSRTRRDRSAEPSSNALFDTQNLTVERKTRTEISAGKRVLKVYHIELNSTVENSVLQDYTPSIKIYYEDGV